MNLIVLGSGSMTSKNACSSYLIESNANYLLLDVGFGSIANLIKIVSPLNVHNVFISHYVHADHIIDIIQLVWSKQLLEEKNQLNIFGPYGLQDFIKKIFSVFPAIKPEFRIKVKELEYDKFPVLNFKVESMPVIHSKTHALAFKVSTEGKAIVYSGDTEFTESLIDFGKDSNLMILDCNNAEKKPWHMTAEECSIIAQKANTKKLLLTHLSHKTQDLDVVSIASQYFKGKIYKAKDLMKIMV